MKKEFICIQCPRGCHLSIDTKTLAVEGNFCPRGASYAETELTNPKRTITSTVKVSGSDIPRCSVRSDKPIKKSLMFDVMALLDDVTLTAPVEVGQIVLENVLSTGVNIIATKKMDKVE